MVFKLGKAYEPQQEDFEINVFSPFKNKAPFNGWFEISYDYQEQWQPMAEKALTFIKAEVS